MRSSSQFFFFFLINKLSCRLKYQRNFSLVSLSSLLLNILLRKFIFATLTNTLCSKFWGVDYPLVLEIFRSFWSLIVMNFCCVLYPDEKLFSLLQGAAYDLVRFKSRTRLGSWNLMECYYILRKGRRFFYEWMWDRRHSLGIFRKLSRHLQRLRTSPTSNVRMHFWIPRQCLFYVFRFFSSLFM